MRTVSIAIKFQLKSTRSESMPWSLGCSVRGQVAHRMAPTLAPCFVRFRDRDWAVERNQFDDITRTLGALTHRRAVARLLGVAAATPFLSLLASSPENAAANTAGRIPKPRKPKKRRVKPNRSFAKSRTFCLNGRTVHSKQKRRIRRWERKGATRGKCRSKSSCNPRCTAGSICVGKTCQVCDVSCPGGDRATCGAALNLALGNGGTIRVCPGEYEGPFPLLVNVEIIGAGSGANSAANTILFGAAGLGSVVPVTSALTARLAALRITGGNGASSNSGGVYVNNAGADVAIDGCALVGNAGFYGGGASVYNGELTITESEISGNAASGNGGGIATATLSTIESTRITGNTAATSGGGIFVNSGTANLGSGVTITGNTANGGAGTGGGIYKFTSGSTINNSATVTNNTPDNCEGNGFTCP